ncbi:M56 family metallopeptidase [Sessilibacter corallicola]|uniref:M56 family metallopeptidase n=1 Tax=Sessilibacter corallicola TaxID=2904075 RepID=UPI001E5E5E0F|nr:M56 family metallopeptidase [Sessilibacter corallicola]MCE2030137.1 M56 family metallopeptidase [Sessilibacter corallicola]
MTSSVLLAVLNYLFGWTTLTVLLSLLLAAGYPVFARIVKHNSAEDSAFFTLIYGLLAPIATTASLVVLSLPALSSYIIADHCHGDDCTPHALHITTDTVEGVVTVIAAVGLLTVFIVAVLMQLMRAQRNLNTLKNFSEPAQSTFRVVETDAHLAWCAGLFKPQIYVSSGLIQSLTTEQLNLVLLHEHSHAVRKDNLRKWCLHWASIIWPKKLRAKIRQDHSNYAELASDAAVARSYNNIDQDVFVSTLQACAACKKPNQEFESVANKLRENAFESQRIEQSTHKDALSRFSFFKSMVITLWLWVAAVISSIYFGHPLLEWLSR